MAGMTAEPIATVVADIRASRVRPHLDMALSAACLKRAQRPQPVVDATAIYQSAVNKDEPIYLYEDHPSIAPPWTDASIAYVNNHDNVLIMQLSTRENEDKKEWWQPEHHEVDWTQVRWVTDAVIWVGGRSQGQPVQTHGPRHMWRFAIYNTGEPADIRWVHLDESYPMENWDMTLTTLLQSLNFVNCRNVDIVEPQRPRPEARRIARTGVTVSTINVFGIGKSTRSKKGEPTGGVPLSSVRGHFARYGPEYDRGLLFGKYAGRFWVPQHARGELDVGERQADYVLKPEPAKSGS